MMLHYSSEQRRVCVRLSSFWQFSPIFLLYEGAVCMLTTEFFESDCLLTFELLLSYRELSQIRNIFFPVFSSSDRSFRFVQQYHSSVQVAEIQKKREVENLFLHSLGKNTELYVSQKV